MFRVSLGAFGGGFSAASAGRPRGINGALSGPAGWRVAPFGGPEGPSPDSLRTLHYASQLRDLICQYVLLILGDHLIARTGQMRIQENVGRVGCGVGLGVWALGAVLVGVFALLRRGIGLGLGLDCGGKSKSKLGD